MYNFFFSFKIPTYGLLFGWSADVFFMEMYQPVPACTNHCTVFFTILLIMFDHLFVMVRAGTVVYTTNALGSIDCVFLNCCGFFTENVNPFWIVFATTLFQQIDVILVEGWVWVPHRLVLFFFVFMVNVHCQLQTKTTKANGRPEECGCCSFVPFEKNMYKTVRSESTDLDRNPFGTFHWCTSELHIKIQHSFLS